MPCRGAQDFGSGGVVCRPRLPASSHKKNNNVEMEAWFARLVLFIDQAGTENGRIQLAWLLAGLPEPTTRRKSGSNPFAKSCPSLWASANLAYLREIDWLSSTLASSASGDPPDTATEENEHLSDLLTALDGPRAAKTAEA